MKQILRRLFRTPAFTVITVLTLAIGIGANTAIFSVISAVLLKPLPYPEPDRLVAVWQTAPGVNITDLNNSPATYFTYREETTTLQDIGLWQRGAVSITGVAEPEQVPAVYTTYSVLSILGVKPVAGRLFTEQDDAPKAAQTAILTHDYWMRRFGGDHSVIGRRLLIDGRGIEVIGVLPESFRFINSRPSVILTMQFNRSEVFIGNFSYQAVARLKPGVTVAQANADVGRMIALLPRKFQPPRGMTFKMLEEARLGPNVRPLKQDVVGDFGKVLWVLMGTVGIVLLIACANVANLLLVRAEGRQQELAVRAALGASWMQIARELLTESISLGVLGGIAGLGVAYGALRLLVATGPARLPRLDEISLDATALAFALAVSMLASVLFGLVPVFKYGGSSVNSALRAGGRSISDSRERHRTRSALVVIQVALALILLVSSGLMLRSLAAMRNVQPGFTKPEQIFSFRISIPQAQVKEPERVARMHNDIAEKLAAIPGVTSVALVNSITMDGNTNNDPIFAADRTYSENQLPPIRRYKHVSPGLFKTMGNQLLAGRDVTWTDVHEKRQVVMVNEVLARELWGSAPAAIGKRVREVPTGIWREVIGVVGNERDDGAHNKPPAIVYWPFMVTKLWGQDVNVRRTMAYVVRSQRAGTMGFLKDVQQAVWSLNSQLPLSDVRTVQEIYDRSMARTSFTLVMLSLASGMALLLGIIGIYGVISYSISQRTREIGIRMALGSPQDKIRQMFLGNGLLLAGIGVVCGLAIAVPLSRLMESLLFDVSPFDPVTYAAVSIILIAAALLATYIPTLRATKVDPINALRAD